MYAKHEVYLTLHQAEHLYEVYSLLKFGIPDNKVYNTIGIEKWKKVFSWSEIQACWDSNDTDKFMICIIPVVHIRDLSSTM